jgi:hypothetical protein
MRRDTSSGVRLLTRVPPPGVMISRVFGCTRESARARAARASERGSVCACARERVRESGRGRE